MLLKLLNNYLWQVLLLCLGWMLQVGPFNTHPSPLLLSLMCYRVQKTNIAFPDPRSATDSKVTQFWPMKHRKRSANGVFPPSSLILLEYTSFETHQPSLRKLKDIGFTTDPPCQLWPPSPEVLVHKTNTFLTCFSSCQCSETYEHNPNCYNIHSTEKDTLNQET